MQCKIECVFVSSHQQIFDFDPQIWYDTLPRENMDEKAHEVKKHHQMSITVEKTYL